MNTLPSPVDRAYSIAFTPRCGSNAICDLLSQNQLGMPTELFQTAFEHNEHFPKDAGRGMLDRFNELIAHYQVRGVFGVKMGHDHRAAVDERLAGAIPGYRSLGDILPNHRWVWISRRDKILQAISLCRAETSDHWLSSGESAKEPQPFAYDYFEILSRLMMVSVADVAWETYFSKMQINFHRIFYEDFFDDVESAMSKLIDFLGGPAENCKLERVHFRPNLRVQRDAVNFEMRERFIADLARVGGREFEAEKAKPLEQWNRFFFERRWRK
jgi:LPS sulfotransferase NodH